LHLIDRLEELVGEARRLPIGSGVVIDRRRLLDLIDQMRVAVPSEVRDARDVLTQREDVLTRAEAEAGEIIAEAQRRLEEKLQESEVVKAAEERGRLLLRDAEDRVSAMVKQAEDEARERTDQAERTASEQMIEADRYALEALKKLENQLGAFMASVRAGIESLEGTDQQQPPPEEAE
jgi:F0F1-type ATP synthase membrane subunit b/b'